MNFDNPLDRIQNCLTHLAQHPMPLEFYNSLTTGEYLMELYTLVKECIEQGEAGIADIKNNINLKMDEIKQELLKQINDETFVSNYLDALKKYWEEELFSIIEKSIRMIHFGLEDGYFVAYIPDSWEDIRFGTIIDIGENYGKLTIEY